MPGSTFGLYKQILVIFKQNVFVFFLFFVVCVYVWRKFEFTSCLKCLSSLIVVICGFLRSGSHLHIFDSKFETVEILTEYILDKVIGPKPAQNSLKWNNNCSISCCGYNMYTTVKNSKKCLKRTKTPFCLKVLNPNDRVDTTRPCQELFNKILS